MSQLSLFMDSRSAGVGRAGVDRTWAVRVVALAVLALALWAVPVRLGVVIGESMAPSFHSGQVFLMSRLQPGERPSRGDVVVFAVNGVTLIKRVLALPGESVWGVDSAEPDGKPDCLLRAAEVPRVRSLLRRHPSVGRLVQVEVPPGSVYVVGDSSGRSVDSREFGPVAIRAIRGRLMWPRPPASGVA